MTATTRSRIHVSARPAFPVFAHTNGASLQDAVNKMNDINGAFKDFKAKHVAKQEEHEEDIETLKAYVRELSCKQAAFERAPRGNGEGVEANRTFAKFIRTGAVQASMATDSGPDGGFTVHEEHENVIRELSALRSGVRKLASNITMTASEYVVPVNLQGTGAGWVAERDERSATDNPKLATVRIVAHEMYAMPEVTQILLDDSAIDIASFVTADIGRRFGDLEADVLINGNGINKPNGLLNYPTVADASWTWGKLGWVKSGDANGFISPSSSVSPSDCLMTLVYRLKAAYKGNASWLMNTTTAGVIRLWKDAQGRPLWTDNIVSGQAPTLLGYPVELDDSMPDVAAGKYPIAFGDFRQGYTVADRIGTRLIRDNLTSKGWVKFYTTKRVGGGITNYEAIKLLRIAS